MSSTYLYGANVHANGIRQHYLRFGGSAETSRQPLVLIPGITSPAITWRFVAERLGQHFDTYVLDVRGRGLSSTGPELDYDTDTCADARADQQAEIRRIDRGRLNLDDDIRRAGSRNLDFGQGQFQLAFRLDQRADLQAFFRQC